MQREQRTIVDLASDDDDDESQSRDRSLSPDLLSNSSTSSHRSPPRARLRSNRVESGLNLNAGPFAMQNHPPLISLLHSPRDNDGSASRSTSFQNRHFTVGNPSRNESDSQWSCRRCTLLNPLEEYRCLACEATRRPQRDAIDLDSDDDDDEEDNVDEVIYQYTMRDYQYHSREQRNQQGTPTSHLVGGGAFLGGVLGAADAYANGSGVAHGVVRGVVSGAVGGALMGEVFRPVPPPSVAAAAGASYRTASSSNAASYATDPSLNHGWGRRGNPSTAGPAPASPNVYHNRILLRNNNIFEHVLQSMSMQRHQNIDDMSYERLLEIFGDGNENRNLAAPPHVISSLPISTISNPLDLPEDKRQCVICMEEYERGDERTMLPCWHGFHKDCVNRWLSSKGCCPVCKTEVGR
ncbi:hypothetical protein HJC23_008794 [Cyclotella cryptica]|uniref:Uncharacterized protein n=1 Tax=Cyclotella cryptica TaxID=29204 RepID=A0ABD3PRG6_9STRA|eukprot:CCRYP_012211-RA/>CCRYP_012211-RA protein AED:0.12 eAED:0.12 QI:0/-1/0/1/-1/1/1/0/408